METSGQVEEVYEEERASVLEPEFIREGKIKPGIDRRSPCILYTLYSTPFASCSSFNRTRHARQGRMLYYSRHSK